MKLQSIAPSIGILLLAMVSLQSGASFSKELFPLVGPLGATTLRLIFAAIILTVIFRPFKTKTTRQEMKPIALYGVALGFMNILIYLAIERIPLGIAVALEFTGPLAVAIFASKKAVDLLYAALAGAGIYLILPVTSSSTPLDPIGIICALLAGVCWAAYIIFGKQAGALTHGGRVTAIGMFVAMIIALPFGIYSSGWNLFNLKALPIALGVAIFSSALPYSLEMVALKNLPKKTFGILMSIEPAIAACSGFIFLGETLTFLQGSAIMFIIVASSGSALSMRARALPQ